LLVFEPSTDLAALCNRASHALETNDAKTTWNLKDIFYGGPEPSGKIAFIFPGQGSQYVGMGRDLVCCFPDALNVLEHVNKTFENFGCLTDIIYPFPAEIQTEKQDGSRTTGHWCRERRNAENPSGIRPQTRCHMRSQLW
jgi:hypothetical protein